MADVQYVEALHISTEPQSNKKVAWSDQLCIFSVFLTEEDLAQMTHGR